MRDFFRRHRVMSAVLIIFAALIIYSLIPIVKFYLEPTPKKYKLNEEMIKPLKNNSNGYFSFIVMSDTASGILPTEASTLKLIAAVNREDRFKKVPIDFVVNVGDVTWRGKSFHYLNYIKLISKIKFPVITAIGNHDDDAESERDKGNLFAVYCGKKEFSFVDRNSYFIVLNDKDSEFSAKQFEWLESELNKSLSYAHRFIFMHKPPFNPYQQSWYRIETCPWSYRFMKLCEKYKVDIVFSGHEYVQAQAEFGGVKYVVSGGGGTLLTEPSWEGGFLNYIVVKVNYDYVSYEVRKIQPPAWLYFTYYMWKDLTYFVRDVLLQ